MFSLRPAAKGQVFPTERKGEAPVLTHHILGILIHIVRTESGKSAFKKEKDSLYSLQTLKAAHLSSSLSPTKCFHLQCQLQVEYFRIGRAAKMAEKDPEHAQITAICRTPEPRGTLWGSWAWKPFLSPIYYSKIPASMTFPEFRGRIQTIAHQGRSSQEIT